LSTNFVIAVSAAARRVGLRSFAAIEPDVSTISTTVAPSFASLNFACGRAKPTRSSTSATAKMIGGT
jgi:hypothetical protein